MFFSPEEDGFSDEVHFERVRDTLQQIDLLYRVVDRYSDTLEIVQKSDDIMPVFQSGKCASLIGVEGLHQIANSSSVLRIYHRLGVRYVTLAHDKNNAFVDSAVRSKNPGVPRSVSVYSSSATLTDKPLVPPALDISWPSAQWSL